MEERDALILLNMIPSFGMKKYEQLVELFGSAEAIFKISQAELKKSELNKAFIENIDKLKLHTPQEEYNKSRRDGVRIITCLDDEYPRSLRQIFSPPLVLYFKGRYKTEDDLALAVVGSRRPSIYGRTTAEKLSQELVRRKVTVISGLARGIDTSAHLGALKGRGRTIAVLGSGLGRIYPPENRKLAREISEKGCLISEFPYETPPLSRHFPRRNRLISGLSLGTIVVEAAVRSGALITANFALEQGKEVFAIPGKIDSPTSAGTNKLIGEGAKMVAGIEDVLEEFKYKFPELSFPLEESLDSQKETNVSSVEKEIFSLIKDKNGQGMHIDEVIRDSQISPGRIAGLLFDLELKGLIKQLSGKRFVKT